MNTKQAQCFAVLPQTYEFGTARIMAPSYSKYNHLEEPFSSWVVRMHPTASEFLVFPLHHILSRPDNQSIRDCPEAQSHGTNMPVEQPRETSGSISFFFKKICIYLVVLGLHCGMKNLQLWHMGCNSLTRGRTWAPYIGSKSLSRWTTRKDPCIILTKLLYLCCLIRVSHS